MVEDEQCCTARNKQKRTEFIFQILRISLYFAKSCFWNNVYSKKALCQMMLVKRNLRIIWTEQKEENLFLFCLFV